MRSLFSRRAMTMIELMVVISIMAIFAGVSLLSLSNRKGRTEIDGTTQEIVSTLRQAQARSVVQASSTSWGVYFNNSTSTAPYFSLFAGSPTGEYGHYRLPSSVRYSSLSSGATTSITFAQITGAASVSTTVSLSTSGGATSTIRVASSGAVSF